MLQSLLGLTAEGLDHRLRVVQPALPEGVNRLEVHGLRVAGARVDLRFERKPDGPADCHVLKVEGKLDVGVER